MEIPIVRNKQRIHFGGEKKCMKNSLKPMYYVHAVIHCMYSSNDVMMMILLKDMENRNIKNIKLKQILIHALFLTSVQNKSIYSMYYSLLTKMDNSRVVNAREAYRLLYVVSAHLELGVCNSSKCTCCLHKSEMHTIKIVELQKIINKLKTRDRIIQHSKQKEFIDTCLKRYNSDYKLFIKETETQGNFVIKKKNCTELFQTNANCFLESKDVKYLYYCVACILFTKTHINQSTSNIVRYNIFRGFIDYILEYPEYNSRHFEILNSICMLAKFSLKFYNISLVYYILIHAVANTFLHNDSNYEDEAIQCDHDNLFAVATPYLNEIHFSDIDKFKFNNSCKCDSLHCSC